MELHCLNKGTNIRVLHAYGKMVTEKLGVLGFCGVLISLCQLMALR